MIVEAPALEALVVTLLVTAIRTILEASPTILVGAVAAAWLRTLATPERVQAIFRGDGLQGVLRTALIALTLPVCSIGVLPILRELRRLGLPTSKLITLCFVAPLLNPISMLYGLTVLSTTQLFLIVAATAILALVISDVSSRFAVVSQVTAQAPPLGLTGGTRLRNLLIASGRIATGWPLFDMMLVVVVSGLTISLIPPGALEAVCDPSNRGGPLIASLLALPQYVGPARGVIQSAAIERAGLSISAGLAIYLAGTSVGAASLLLLTRWYGLRRVAALAIAVSLSVCLVAYASGVVLRAPVGLVEETSGFDDLARPTGSTIDQVYVTVSKSHWFADPVMVMGTVALGLLVLAGGVIRLAKVGYRNDDPETASNASHGRMSQAVPASQLGAIAICGLSILLCLATYVFLPNPSECMDEMKAIQMDAHVALLRGDVSEALDRINAWDSVAARLPISAAVHFAFPTQPQRRATRDLRMGLHRTRALLQEGDAASAKEKIPDLLRLLSETRDTFAKGSS